MMNNAGEVISSNPPPNNWREIIKLLNRLNRRCKGSFLANDEWLAALAFISFHFHMRVWFHFISFAGPYISFQSFLVSIHFFSCP